MPVCGKYDLITNQQQNHMKKILLFGALGAMAFGAQAETFTDLYKVTFEGKEVKNGETLHINKAEYDDEWEDWTFDEVKIVVESTGSENRAMYGALYSENPATTADFKNEYGDISLCFASSPLIGGQCVAYSGPITNLFAETIVNVGPAGWIDDSPFGTQTGFQWQLHCSGVLDSKKEAVAKLVMTACDGLASNAVKRSETMEVFLNFCIEGNSVESIAAAGNGVAEYYGIDGRRLEGPVKGLYIVKENGKVSKKIGR